MAENTTSWSDHPLQTERGYYYGTIMNGIWWRRYIKGGWFSRGNATIWIRPEGLSFRRYLTKKIMHIPVPKIKNITTGKGGTQENIPGCRRSG